MLKLRPIWPMHTLLKLQSTFKISYCCTIDTFMSQQAHPSFAGRRTQGCVLCEDCLDADKAAHICFTIFHVTYLPYTMSASYTYAGTVYAIRLLRGNAGCLFAEQLFRICFEVLRRAAVMMQYSIVVLLAVPVVDPIVSPVTS